jgi:hypothetical protein
MAQYAKMAPVTLSFTVTFDGVTSGGKCRAVEDSVVMTGMTGPGAENFRLVVTRWGDLLAIDGRLAQRREPKAALAPAPAPAPAPLTAAQKAQIPANGTKARKGKAAPEPVEAEEEDADLREYREFMAFKAMKAKASK